MNIKDVIKMSAGNKCYPIRMEIAGEFAMFSRPDTGSEKTSYASPTFSAVKGIIESILYLPDTVNIIPIKVEICKPIQYQKWSFNYNGILRKSDLINNENSCQIRFLILRDVCYKIYATVVNSGKEPLNEKYKNINHAHSFQEQFNRRIKNCRSYRTPCLGMSEFLPSYVGEFREDSKPCEDINFKIPSMLFSCFDQFCHGEYNPTFAQNVNIEKGILNYVK